MADWELVSNQQQQPTTTMTTNTFDFDTFAHSVLEAMPFDEGMVLYIPRIYPDQRGGPLEEDSVARKIEMECLEQDLGEVLQVDLQMKEPAPGERFFQAFVHLRWHDNDENRQLQQELSRANTVGPDGAKCPAPKLQVENGFWVLLPRSPDAAWRANSEMSPGSPAEAKFAAWLKVQDAPVTTAITPTPPSSPVPSGLLARPVLRRAPRRSQDPSPSPSPSPSGRPPLARMSRHHTAARCRSGARFGLEGVNPNPNPDPIEEYSRTAGVSDPDAVASQCRRLHTSLTELRAMARRLGAEREIATTCGCSLADAESLIRHEDKITSGEIPEHVACDSALAAARAVGEEVARARETWSRQGLEGGIGH